jgi:PAS domain S-box-containing protein
MFSDKDFRELFENAPIGLAVCDFDGQMHLVNQAFADILGRSIEETLKLEYWHVTPRRYEKQEQEQLAEARKGRYGPYEKHFLHKNGSLVPVRLNGCKVTIDGESYIWSTVERLEMPIHSVMLFREAPVGLALCQMDGKLVAVNEAFADMIGRTVEDTLELGYWELTPKKYKADEDQQLEEVKATGKYGPYEKEYIHRDGSRVPVVLIGKLLRLSGEEFIWSVCQKRVKADPIPHLPADPIDGGSIADLMKDLMYSTEDREPIKKPDR